jgi:outer membrane receptor protein involved in Fe transport
VKTYRNRIISLGLIPLAVSLFGQTAPTNTGAASRPASEDEAVELEEFVVTGVFNATSLKEATVAISTIDLTTLATQVPVSATDLLLNIPGVFVNSSTGEIRTMMYSRGSSVNTSETSFGFYYVSMQEEGLPVSNLTQGNYGPDYFLRPDATLFRVESVRGGSAAVTAANAPGGVFNYISKTGTTEHRGEVRARLGMEGEWSPYYRGDVNLSGPVGESGWLYNVGGFYRKSDGHRPMKDNPMNDGYQIKANLFKDYGNGSLKVYTKYLDDKNHWYEYQLAFNPIDPVQVPGLTRYSTNLFPAAKFTYPREAPDRLNTFDTTEAVHNRQKVLGTNWNHDFDNGWTISNNSKISRSTSDWNSSASITPRSLAWPNFFNAMQFTFNSQNNPTNAQSSQNGRVPAGTYRFFDQTTRRLMAEVTSNGSYATTGEAPSNPGQIVTVSKVPYRDLEISTGSFDAVWTNTGLVFNRHNDEVMSNVTVTKTFDKVSFSAGGFYSYADILDRSSTGGRTVAGLEEQPVPYQITWTPATATSAPAGTPDAALAAVAGWNGQTVQLTNHSGFATLGQGGSRFEAIAVQLAAFAGGKWDIREGWSVDFGMRMENYRVRGVNAAFMQNPRSNWDPTYGGADGNPLTMYDNRFMVENPAQVWNYDKDVDSISWSVATNHVLNDSSAVYLRYAYGEKAPDYGFFKSYNSQFRINTLQGIPQTMEQWEIGYRYDKGRLNFVATPFWSRLGDVFSYPQATEADGVTQYYPDPIFNIVTTFGLELEGGVQVSQNFSIRTVFTWQESEGTRWVDFQAGSPGRQDDKYVDFSGKPMDNNPDFMLNTTFSYSTPKYFANLQWKHMGERPGNIPNVIVLPRFNQFDFAFGYNFSDRFSMTLNVNNVLDDEGVMTWRGWGVNTINRQGFTSIPATGDKTMLQIVPIPPRAYFLSAVYKF